MDDVALTNYLAGLTRGPVEAGRLNRALARVLGVAPGTPIWLSDYSWTKIKIKHPEIGFREYVKLPLFLSDGFVVRGGRRRPCLEIYYFDPSEGALTAAKLVLKATSKGEVYVSTLFKLDRLEVRRLYRRAVENGTLVRDLKNELTRQLLAAPVP